MALSRTASTVAPISVAMTPFIGRAFEIETAARLLKRADVRVLTLTGSGGVGKTRLAIEVAERVRDDFGDGVAFVGLAPLRDPQLVPAAIGQVLSVLEDTRESVTQIAEAIGERQLLLVLDNCEHVLDAAPTIAELIASAPRLKILATSRIPLDLSVEQQFAVPPLHVPSVDQQTSLTSLAENDAIRLFLQRARGVSPAFALTAENADAVIEVCRQVDGLPLAIELAAARTKVLAPEALLARLNYRLAVLTNGPRDRPDRQRSVRDTVAWSYDLLDEREMQVFRALGVFRNGFALDAADAVTSGDADVFDVVASLLNKSLLIATDPVGGEPRFGMLETIREFALDRLIAAGEDFDARQRHADWCLAFGERAEWALHHGPAQATWVSQIDVESANLVIALEWLGQNDPVARLRLSAALSRFWLIRGRLTEGRSELEAALATAPAASRARVRALVELGLCAIYQRDDGRALSATLEAEQCGRAMADNWSVAYAMGARATRAVSQLILPEAEELARQSLAIWDDLASDVRDDRSWLARNALAIATLLGGAVELGDRLAEEFLAHVQHDRNDFAKAIALHRVGAVALARNDSVAALRAFLAAIDIATQIGSGWLVAYSLDGLAGAAAGHADDEQATRWRSAAAHMRKNAGVTLFGPLAVAHDRAVVNAKTALGEERFSRVWAEGHALSIKQIAEEAAAFVEANQHMSPRATMVAQTQSNGFGLTEREVEVLGWIVTGLTAPQIADRLFVSPRTIHTHLSAIYRKLDVSTRGEAVRVAVERGLV